MSRSSVTDALMADMVVELSQEFRPVYDMILKLEKEYPVVANSQKVLTDPATNGMLNCFSALVYQAQTIHPKSKSKKQIRQAVFDLSHTPLFGVVMIQWMLKLYPAVVILTEHMYFQNRCCIMEFSLTAARLFVPEKAQYNDWVYPPERIDEIRGLAYKIWSKDVLQATEHE